jgi:uncharacterized phage protein (TIGR01671 family)
MRKLKGGGRMRHPHFSDGDILQADDMDMDCVEVIGNIYENPDLLEEC